jgi:hypothetical protein
MPNYLYQCLIFGNPTDDQFSSFETSFTRPLLDFGLEQGREFVVTRGITTDFCPTAATVAIYFGGVGSTFEEHAELIRLSIPVVPLVTSVQAVSTELPECLRSINALALDHLDTDLIRPAGVALQCLGLLPPQRRVFLSYRRDGSRDVAVQLFEALSARQFDVFLDTHSVAAGADFQAMLWHRLCDSDVVVMLDTPGYFESRWTTKEWGRAIDKHISILQVIWPGHVPSRYCRLATPMQLLPDDLVGSRLSDAVVSRVALQVETLRSKSISVRHANIAGGIRSAVEELGGMVEGVGQRRSIVLKMPSGAHLVAYPVVGVPTAITLHEVAHSGDSRPSVLVYDHVGLSNQWMQHLDWLGTNILSVKWIKSRQLGWDLADLEGV